VIRVCDGNDPNLLDADRNPCRCSLRLDDVELMTIYPHDPVGGRPLVLAESRPRQNGKLFDALREVGVTPADYLEIEKARHIVDRVNALLAARGATVIYAVTCNPVGQMPNCVTVEPLDIFTEVQRRRAADVTESATT